MNDLKERIISGVVCLLTLGLTIGIFMTITFLGYLGFEYPAFGRIIIFIICVLCFFPRGINLKAFGKKDVIKIISVILLFACLAFRLDNTTRILIILYIIVANLFLSFFKI